MKTKLVRTVTVLISVILAFFWLYPFIIIFINSLKTKSALFANPLTISKSSFNNYIQAFKDLDFVQSFFNSLLITVSSVILITILASMAAYALARTNSKISSIIYYLCAATMLIPFQSIMIPLITIFGKIDFLNRFSLILMNTGLSLSLSIILYYGAFLGVPRSIDEAAMLDGANTIKAFFGVILPAVAPMTGTVIILNAMKIWNDYLLPSLVINKDGMYTIPIKMYYFFSETNSQWQLALAGLVLAIMPIIILFILLQKQIMHSATEGAIQ
ncbi:carbohydrate ABC transporter permease [Oenococcus sicerae]|uniref:Carbohydrate ABC transporter permease n=1 Tax=Oenococcus sicerae TaxID=2203724 RepID=A0ABX5QKV4_9LACO|nr:carbohydrate ABC transporter permease [Oenococcus sicerae]QAS69411.1 carbohydrate ABC transporter permease [Oenococcus sicerae]VDK14154.1 L-arabinose transport system permease protein AraQ [Oenococcus sicerae]